MKIIRKKVLNSLQRWWILQGQHSFGSNRSWSLACNIFNFSLYILDFCIVLKHKSSQRNNIYVFSFNYFFEIIIALNLLYNLYEYDIDRFKVPFTTFHAKICCFQYFLARHSRIVFISMHIYTLYSSERHSLPSFFGMKRCSLRWSDILCN